ncbi:hypothetical protein PoB_003233600 [Plakobranchus ocellatus]|uniref:Uncharacterized protein n=1 Tax=Plakobranchus ocellatus TaxID=259542 RepID=A0AAV4A3J6_9GAST|nr:hypothetical protein PoB_003233600 [Plakobranchus ocellatus]
MATLLDQGNMFLRHLVDESNHELKHDESSDESNTELAGDDIADETHYKSGKSGAQTTSIGRSHVDHSEIRPDSLKDQRKYDLDEDGADHTGYSSQANSRAASKTPPRDGCLERDDDEVNDQSFLAQKHTSVSRRGSGSSRRSSQHFRRESLLSDSGHKYIMQESQGLDEENEDEERDDSDDIDEDEEDGMPGLARAHLDYDDNDSTENKNEQDEENRENENMPTTETSQEDAKNDLTDLDIGTKLANPDVMDIAQLMDSVRNIGVSNLGQLQRLNRNDPALKRLLVRPRLSIREVKAIRLDPDIKAIVDDFLRTNITGDFTIARVLRENYASFHPWLASHIQAERNAWAVKLQQAMDTEERVRRDGLESAALVVEAGLRLRELVQTCSGCMFGYPKTQSHSVKDATRKGVGLAQGKFTIDHQKNSTNKTVESVNSSFTVSSKTSFSKSYSTHPDSNHGCSNLHQQQSLQQRSAVQQCKPTGAVSQTSGRAQASSTNNTAGSILRLNGLAKASLASDVDIADLNQKLVRLTTIVGKDGARNGELADKSSDNINLTPSPMNILRVEDANIYNYESDPGVYYPAHDTCGSNVRIVRRKARRGLHEGYLNNKRTTVPIGATPACDSTPSKISNLTNTSTPSLYYKSTKDSYHPNKSLRGNRGNPWVLLDLDTLLDREFGPDSEGNNKGNDTDWTVVIRNNLEVLTEICQTLVCERLDCMDILGSRAVGESASLVYSLQEYTRARQASEEKHQEEMEYRLQQLEDENQALQAEMTALQKTLSDTNSDALNLRQQLARLEALVNGERPERVNKCVGTADSLPSFMPKPRMPGGGSGNNVKNGFNPFNTLHTATVVYAGGGSNRYTAKATLIKAKQKREKREKTMKRAAQYFSEAHPSASETEAASEDNRNHCDRVPNLSMSGCVSHEPSREKDGGSAQVEGSVIPEIRLGLATRERSLVEISEEKLQTLKQRAQRLESSLQDAISSMERANKPTAPTDADSFSQSGASISSRSRDLRHSGSGRESARLHGEKSRFWTEASFEVNGSPPPHGRHPHDSYSNSYSQEAVKTPRSGRLVVIKRPSDYTHAPNHPLERRAASETLPYTLEHEKSSLLSGRAVPLASNNSPQKVTLPPGVRQKASPVSVVSTNSNKDSNTSNWNNNNNLNISKNKLPQSDSNIKDYNLSRVIKANTNASKTNEAHRSSFHNSPRFHNREAITSNTSNNPSHKECSDATSANVKKVISRPKNARSGGVVAKCLRCQKLFNSVDNHKLACCYHPKEKARFEHYDGSGRLMAVVHAWQCCQQPQDADGCCFGQHV